MHSINLSTEAFNSKRALFLTGISPKQLNYWDKQGIVKPSMSPAAGRGSRRFYSYLDLLALVTVKNLKDGGLTLQKIRRCVSFLRRHKPDVSQPCLFFKLIACGDTVYVAQDEEAYLDVLKQPGQTAHGHIIDVAMLDQALRDSVLEITARRMEEVSVGDYAYQVEVEPDLEDGGYVATVAGLPGCITDGESLEEVLENARDAITCWLEGREHLAQRNVHVPVHRRSKRRRRQA